jgi:hypothetical protein
VNGVCGVPCSGYVGQNGEQREVAWARILRLSCLNPNCFDHWTGVREALQFVPADTEKAKMHWRVHQEELHGID